MTGMTFLPQCSRRELPELTSISLKTLPLRRLSLISLAKLKALNVGVNIRLSPFVNEINQQKVKRNCTVMPSFTHTFNVTNGTPLLKFLYLAKSKE